MLVNQNHECEFAQGKSFRVKLWNLWKVITPRKAIYGTAADTCQTDTSLTQIHRLILAS